MWKVWRAMIMIAAVLVLASCSFGSDDDAAADETNQEVPQEVVDSEDAMKGALADQIDDYAWPQSYQPDPDKVFDRSNPGGVFENESAYAGMILVIFNQCAWNLEWLDARTGADADAESAALRMLVDTIPGQWADTISQDQSRRTAEAAQLGDIAPIQQFVEQNCEPVDWTTAT